MSGDESELTIRQLVIENGQVLGSAKVLNKE